MDRSISVTERLEDPDQPRWYEWSAVPALGAVLTAELSMWTGFFRMGGVPTPGPAALLALRALLSVIAVSIILFILRRPLARLSRPLAWLECGWGTARSRAAFAELLGFGGGLVAINALRLAHPATAHELFDSQAVGVVLLAAGAAATAWMLRLMPAAQIRSGRPAAGIGVLVCVAATWAIGAGGWL